MYDYLVLPECNDTELDTHMGVSISPATDIALDPLHLHSAQPQTLDSADFAYPSDPYYTYDNGLAIDDVMFPSVLSPELSSDGTSPHDMFDYSYLDKPSAKDVQTGYLNLNLAPPLGSLDLLHDDPLASLLPLTSPMSTCQPTPVHSRSQSYSDRDANVAPSTQAGPDMAQMAQMGLTLPAAPAAQVTPALSAPTPTMHRAATADMSHMSHNMPHMSHAMAPMPHTHEPALHDPMESLESSPESCDSPCSDDEEIILSLDESPSANGILFKNLSCDEQTKYKKYHCPVCKKYFRRDLPRHLRIHQRVARFVCPYPRDQCSHKRGQFNRPYDYKKHLLHSHFQFDEAKLVRGFRDLKSKLTHYGSCNCGKRFRADKWLDDHVMKCLGS